MSATRNPFYQLPGGADLPGDVRVSDTADASKTAADGWAASPAAVANAITEMEYGAFVYPDTISDKNNKSIEISFQKKHDNDPRSVSISYRFYGYFYGALHIDNSLRHSGVDNTGISVRFIPLEIGNGLGTLIVDWLAIW